MDDVMTNGDDAIVEIPFEECLDMRHTVLHPSKSRDFSRVEGDESATHYGVRHDGKFIACLSIFGQNPAQIRKFATLPEYQGQGYGSKLMDFTLDKITGPVFLDARTSAIGFYKRFGFKQVGSAFYKGDIEHFRMEFRM